MSQTGKTIEELLELYETFLEAIKPGLDGFEVSVTKKQQFTAANITEIEKLLGTKVPEDLCTLWKIGFRDLSVLGVDSACTSLDLASAKRVTRQIAISLDLHEEYPPDEYEDDEVEVHRLLRYGVPFSDDSNYFLVDTDPEKMTGVRRMGVDPEGEQLTPVAATFTDWFEVYLASGCYHHGDANAAHFRSYWQAVASKVPLDIPPQENRWLRFQTKWYIGDDLT